MPHCHNGSTIATTISAVLAIHPAIRRPRNASDGTQDHGRCGTECTMRILITFRSKHGGTGGVADMLGLSRNVTGFPASALAKTHAGDWRDEAHIRRWAESVVIALKSREGADS